MAERRVMPKPLQISTLKDIFRRLNPDVDPAVIDWEIYVDETLSLPENRLEMEERFPIYRWFTSPEERESIRGEAERELREDIEYLSFVVRTLPPEVAEPASAVIEAFEKRAESVTRLRRRTSALRREAEEWRRKAEAVPPPVGVPIEEHLWEKFSAVLKAQGLPPANYRTEFDTEYLLVRGQPREGQQRIIERLARDIIAREVKPPEVRPPPPPPAPPVAPPVSFPPAAALMPRVRRIETFKCWGVPGEPPCPEPCVIDRDLEEKVRTIPVMKAWDPRGMRVEPLLMFPPLFYLTCEAHRYEKFGYRDIYDALAYLLAEARSSTRRLTVTKASLKEVGLDAEDLREIQAREATWLRRVE